MFHAGTMNLLVKIGFKAGRYFRNDFVIGPAVGIFLFSKFIFRACS